MVNQHIYNIYEEVRKAGGHKPQHLPLLCHILAFLSSGSHKPQLYGLPAIITFLNNKSALKLRFSTTICKEDFIHCAHYGHEDKFIGVVIE